MRHGPRHDEMDVIAPATSSNHFGFGWWEACFHCRTDDERSRKSLLVQESGRLVLHILVIVPGELDKRSSGRFHGEREESGAFLVASFIRKLG